MAVAIHEPSLLAAAAIAAVAVGVLVWLAIDAYRDDDGDYC